VLSERECVYEEWDEMLIELVKKNRSYRRFDEKDIHHVPKRTLDEIILH
jgi:hypothetical protein